MTDEKTEAQGGQVKGPLTAGGETQAGRGNAFQEEDTARGKPTNEAGPATCGVGACGEWRVCLGPCEGS